MSCVISKGLRRKGCWLIFNNCHFCLKFKHAASTLSALQNNTISIFCTRIWSVSKPLIYHTQNLEITHAYKYKTKLQPKMKRRENKNDILVCHQFTYVPEKHRFAYRPHTRAENLNAVFFCYKLLQVIGYDKN